MNFYEFVKELTRLNPNEHIALLQSGKTDTIAVGLGAQLKLPAGFVYEAGTITNKGSANNADGLTVQLVDVTKSKICSAQAQHNLIAKALYQPTSENYDIFSFYKELSDLNPNLKLDLADLSKVQDAATTIYFTPDKAQDGKKSVAIPKGFAFDPARKVFTNRDISKTGNYIEIAIVNTEKVEDKSIKSAFLTKKQISHALEKSERYGKLYKQLVPDVTKTNNQYELFVALQKLNPNVKFRMPNAAVFNDEVIFVESLNGQKKLNLPDGFTYDQQYGLTNKNSIKSGSYVSIPLEKYHGQDEKMFYTDKQIAKLMTSAMNAERNSAVRA